MARSSAKPPTLRSTLAEPQRRTGGRLQFVRETVSELRKVVWPSRQETMRLTVLVIAISVAAGIFLGLVDLGFNQVFTRFFVGG